MAGSNVSPQPDPKVQWRNVDSRENNMIVVKVFNPAKRLLYTAQIDTSTDIFEQIAELVYLEDWGSVEVIGENMTSNSSAIKIDLKEIESVTIMQEVEGESLEVRIQESMRLFKNQFNMVCTTNINNSRKKYKKVELEVTKKIFEDPGWAQMKPGEVAGTFEAIDTDPKDKKITNKEWFGVLRGVNAADWAKKLGLKEVKGQENGRHEASRRFNDIDTDNNKSLSRGEFSKFYRAEFERKKLVDLKHDLWIAVAAEK
jgi:hypothetical protein